MPCRHARQYAQCARYLDMSIATGNPAAALRAGIAQLSLLLADPTPASQSTFSGVIPHTIPAAPGIFLTHNDLPLSLPLFAYSQWESLATVAHPLSAAGSSQPLALVLGPDRFRIANPAWESGINQFVTESVLPRLGCSPNNPAVQVRLQQLVVHGPGFCHQADSSRGPAAPEDQCIATLLIQLPSIYNGGQFTAFNTNNCAFPCDFGAADRSSVFSLYFTCYLAQASHTFRPIEAGYRTCLVYSIVAPQYSRVGSPQAAILHDSLVGSLAKLSEQRTQFHLFAQEPYTNVQISARGFSAVSGKDLDYVTKLQLANRSLSAHLRYSFFLVYAERVSVHYGPWDLEQESRIEEWESTVGYGQWYDAHGHAMGMADDCQKALGQLVNPENQSTFALWSHGSVTSDDHESDPDDWEACNSSATDTTCKTFIIVGVPNANGWSLVSVLGVKAVLKKMLPADPLPVTAAHFNSILASLPENLRSPSPPTNNPTLFEHTPFGLRKPAVVDLFTELLEILISHDLIDSMEPFFAAIPNPFNKSTLTQFSRVLKMPALWQSMRLHLTASLSRSPNAYDLGIDLVLGAIDGGVPESIWTDLLTAITSNSLPPSKLEQLKDYTRHQRLVKAPPVVWQQLAPRIAESLPGHASPFYFGLDFLRACTDRDGSDGSERIGIPIDSFGKMFTAVVALPVPAAFDFTSTSTAYTFDWWMKYDWAWPQLVKQVAQLLLGSDQGFSHGLKWSLSMIKSRKPNRFWVELARAIGSKSSLTTTELTRAKDSIVAAMQYPNLWLLVSNVVEKSLSQFDNGFSIGLDLVKMSHQQFCPPSTWNRLVWHMCARVPCPSTHELSNWSYQSVLWRLLVQGLPSATAKVVTAYVQANQPARLDIVMNELKSIVPTLSPAARAPLAPLFRQRLEYLQSRIHALMTRPTGDPLWTVPTARFPANTQVQEFLRTPMEGFRVTGEFASITQARSWLGLHQDALKRIVGRKTLNMSASGSGARAHVDLVKVPEIADKDQWKLRDARDEYAELKISLEVIIGPTAPAVIGGQPLAPAT